MVTRKKIKLILLDKIGSKFLDATTFATGTTTSTTTVNGKKSSTSTGPVSPVTSPILSASASGGTRVCVYIYI